MRSRPAAWMGAAFAANLFLAAIILVARGTGVHGIETALRATARVSFLWFWVAYAGGALATLFGAAFLPLRQHGREFGLAFAAALLVHLILVGWLCWIGAAPRKGCVHLLWNCRRPYLSSRSFLLWKSARDTWSDVVAAVANYYNEFHPLRFSHRLHARTIARRRQASRRISSVRNDGFRGSLAAAHRLGQPVEGFNPIRPES